MLGVVAGCSAENTPCLPRAYTSLSRRERIQLIRLAHRIVLTHSTLESIKLQNNHRLKLLRADQHPTKLECRLRVGHVHLEPPLITACYGALPFSVRTCSPFPVFVRQGHCALPTSADVSGTRSQFLENPLNVWNVLSAEPHLSPHRQRDWSYLNSKQV